MGTKGIRYLIVIGVLLVVTVPLALAKPEAVRAQDVDQAQQEANSAAASAQEEADRQTGSVQGDVSESKHDAYDGAREAKGTILGAADTLLSTVATVTGAVHVVLDPVYHQAMCFAFWNCVTQPDQGTFDASSAISSPSRSWVPDSGAGVAGLSMVVAATAVGAALLWSTVFQRALGMGLAVPLLSRIQHSEIYENDARRQISQMCGENPGVCLNEIVAKTGYSRNAVSYHLFVLEKEEEIVSIKDGKYRRYFPRGGKYVNGAKNVVSALRNPTTLTMAQYIVQNPGTIQRELCKLLGTTASAACWHAKRLETLGVIRKQRVANTVQYYPGEALIRYDLGEFGLAAVIPAAPAAPVPTMPA